VIACGGGSAETTASSAPEETNATTAGTASGVTVGEDCESNLAAIQALVDEGGTYNELSAEEQAEATEYLGAATNLCDTERRQEFAEQDDVAAWLGHSD
jgi:hypothetical protein